MIKKELDKEYLNIEMINTNRNDNILNRFHYFPYLNLIY